MPGLDFVRKSIAELGDSYEARASAYFRDGKFGPALDQAALWLTDQPFSSRPAASASNICSSVLDEHERAIEFCKRGLHANPGEPTLENNLAFALACLGDLDGAEAALNRIATDKLTEEDKPAVLATKGLLAYRRRRIRDGAELYMEGYRLASRHPDRAYRSLVLLNWAREEILSGIRDTAVVDLVRRDVRSDSPEHVRLLEKKVFHLAATGEWQHGVPTV
jgi:tetratricopeptide (TPR) repeat protein